MRSEVIFFDIGHTLVTGAEESPRRLLGSRLKLTERETRLIGRMIMTHPATEPASLLTGICEVLPHQDTAQVQDAVENLWKEQIECVREIRGATSLFKSLKAEGFRLGIISNIWHPFFEGVCRTCREMLGLVDFTVLSYRIGEKKPSLDLYRHAVEITGEAPANCWMIGDTYELDMEPARAVGMRTIWVLGRPEKERALIVRLLRGEKPMPDWVAADLEEIFPFLMNRKGERR